MWISLSLVLQFSTDELVKEVENSIAEFKRQKQEYDEERVREQVLLLLSFWLNLFYKPMLLSLKPSPRPV